MQNFPQFPCLPAELRIQIWQEAASVSRAHTFDVCFPSRMVISCARSKRGMLGDEPSGVYLAHVPVTGDESESSPREDEEGEEQEWRCPKDSPSNLYASIRLSCSEAFEALRSQNHRKLQYPSGSESDFGSESDGDVRFNTVFLPVQEANRYIYENARDLLHLRFGSALPSNSGFLDPNCSAEDDYTPRVFKSSLSDMFLYPWSSGLTSTLQNARMIALDIADLELAIPLSLLKAFAPGSLEQEVGYLANRLSKLEVLYVVDYSIGLGEHGRETDLDHGPNPHRGSAAPPKVLSEYTVMAQNLQTRLSSAPSTAARHPSVFHGKGVTYREVLDLEALGWDENSSVFVVLKIICEEIWKMQSASAKGGEGVRFQGVRVLKCS
ncbi:hypothetical protein BDW69DRAFT_162401 [Aspergillus filifer]